MYASVFLRGDWRRPFTVAVTRFNYISIKRSFYKVSPLQHDTKDVKLTTSYSHGCSNIPLQGSTIGQILDEMTDKHPDKNAFIYGNNGERQTYRQLKDEVDRFAAGLVAVGVGVGDRVGIWGPNSREWIVTQYATARIGAILVNVNPAYRTLELDYALQKVGMKAIISARHFKTQDYYGMLQELCPELRDSTPGNLRSSRLPNLKTVILMGDEKTPGTFTYNDVMEMETEERKQQVQKISDLLQFDDPINIQFTSGTTGFPKATVLSHHGILNNARFVGFRHHLDQQESTMCLPIPLYHCAGMIGGSLSVVTHGSTCVLPSPSFEPSATLEAIQNERCTSIIGTPTIYIALLNHPERQNYDMSSMQTGIMGGATCPVETMKEFKEQLNVRLLPGFGMTECSLGVLTILVDGDMENSGAGGRPFEHIELKIIDPKTNKISPVDTTGELCVRGYNVMRGYWNDPEKTREAIDEEKWFHTGDLASMSSEGRCTIVGRLKDMVIRGGTNIFPAEIEQFLYEHEKIEDAQVIGVPDDVMGEELCACIKLKEGKTATADEIKEYCTGKITHYKIPRYVEFVDSYPMTVTLKVQKFQLQKDMAKKLGL
ncbi:medium-chain acyl-CoA ligase ACSF2, mitochondrial-like isoform X1 [Apostichopus japonicus]|uniref:medium-chain acyl-CoA ligase ACSF2, mitochondrial-like isoform X1 n=2 Tax=Stichopus japonicus TaxID=307972 RepID=UPI003AB1C8DB